jgi:hypothetical protein
MELSVLRAQLRNVSRDKSASIVKSIQGRMSIEVISIEAGSCKTSKEKREKPKTFKRVGKYLLNQSLAF